MELIYFGLYIASYYILHSVFASNRIKFFLTKNILPFKYYRIFYNLLATILLIPIPFIYSSIEKDSVFQSTFLNEISGLILLLVGIVVTIFALRQYDLSEFSGSSHLKQTAASSKGKLNTDGLNAHVRHPLYFGSLLFFWGLFLMLPNIPVLVLTSISTIYLIVGTRLEETKLVKVFGKEYVDYQKRVPMLLPNFF